MPQTTEAWTLEGVNLGDLGATTIENRSGWDVQVGRRGEPITIPYRHGAYTVPKKYMEANDFSLTIVVLDRQSSGAPYPGGPFVGEQTNMDTIKGLLYSGGLLTLDHLMPDGTTRQALVETYVATPWRERAKGLMEITALFSNSEGTWRELPIDGESGIVLTGSLDVGGNAPVGDSVVTATATNTDGPYDIEIGGATATIAALTIGDVAVIDSGSRQTFIDTGGGLGDVPADATIKLDKANWFELTEASANAVTATAGITVDVDWYNRWL